MTDLNELLGGLLGGAGGAGGSGGFDINQLSSLIGPVMGMLGGAQGANGASGLEGLLAAMQSGGLGDAANSWVSPGENQAVDPNALANAIGPDAMGQLAQQSGLSTDDVANNLSQVLPDLVNNLTPNGQVPSTDDLTNMLGGLTGGNTDIAGMLGGLFGQK